ncbi:MAG: HAMP domain-containing sensor histidine kinase [Bacillota bacterium]|nr:HAMP domain-containing sensor histidine kinase [Bacillota bacterium]
MIRHSVFKKMIAIYLIVSVSAMVLLGLLAGILITRMEVEASEAFLREKLGSFRSMATLVDSGEITLAQYKKQLDAMGKAQGYSIYLFPTELGRVQLENLKEKLADKQLLGKLPPNVLDGILAGEDVAYDGRYGSAQVVILAGPVVSGEGKDYSVVLVKSSKEAVTGQTYMLWGLGAAFLVLTAAAAAVLGFAVRKFTRPLVQISRVCEAVAAGDYTQKVDVRSKDETGVIADSVNSMVEKLSHLNTAQKEFTANISHELRTPLTIIRANLQAVREGIIPLEDCQEFLDSALSETKRMGRLVGELIDLTSLDSSSFAIEPEEKDFAQTVNEAASLAKIPCKRKEVMLNTDIGNFTACCDHNRMLQVLANILENAIRHTPQGGEMTLKSYKEKGMLHVEIENTGSHIAQKDMERIFEKQFKGPGSKGNGLGLYLCKAIMEAHGGAIDAENTKKGVKFSLSAPI